MKRGGHDAVAGPAGTPPPSAPRRRPHPRPDAVLTAEGKKLLEEKAHELETLTLPTLRDVVAEDPHDATTRAAYENAAAELRRVHAVLAQAQPLPTQPRRSDQVSLGDRITVTFLASADTDLEPTEVFLLVHPLEAPLDSERISVASPLGRAVLGQCVGDVVAFDTPTGTRRVRVLDCRPPT